MQQPPPIMGRRRYRLSDVVAMVCTPCAVLLYVHLSVVSYTAEKVQLQQSSLRTSRGPEHPEQQISREEGTNQSGARVLLTPPPPPIPPLPPAPKVPLGPPLNITPRGAPEQLLFTPILQSGSSSVKNLLGFLKTENHFKLISEPPQKTLIVHIDKEEVKARIVNTTAHMRGATALVHSFAYLDFPKYGGRQPVQVSVVREPVDRAVALFYRARAPYQVVERHVLFPDLELPKRNFLKKSIEACLDDPQDKECRRHVGRTHFGHTIEFFCGHHPQCAKFGSAEALALAKRHVEKSYAVVGLLEEWPLTLAVLERYVPRFFANATAKYYDKIHGKQFFMNKNFYKPKVAPWVRAEIARNMTVEVAFYNFLKERLKRQYAALFRTND